MNFAAVCHRADAPYSYAVRDDEVILQLQTDLQVERVFLHWRAPFEAGILGGAGHWTGQVEEITERLPLAYVQWWTMTIQPPYKHCRYYFELRQGAEVWFYGEDGICSPEKGEPAGFYRRRRNTPCFRYGDISRILRIAIIGKSVYNKVK